MARKLLIAVALLVLLLGVLVIVIHRQPSEFTIRRSMTIAAPPEAVFALVDDFRAWETWSPWTKLDPGAKMTYSDPSAGKGASLTWSGNDQVGEGHLTIVVSKAPTLIDIEQVFVRPMPGTARMLFTFAPHGTHTRVTWRMIGTNDFLGKAVCLFMDLDARIGKDFEEGLARMRAAAEKGAAGDRNSS